MMPFAYRVAALLVGVMAPPTLITGASSDQAPYLTVTMKRVMMMNW